MSDVTCPRCGDTYDHGKGGHFCLHPTDDGDPYARVSTLEARIAELERERDWLQRNVEDAAARRDRDMDVLKLATSIIPDAMALAAARADRDEAVRLLRKLHRWHGGTASLKKAIDAYLALHPAQPETPTKGPR